MARTKQRPLPSAHRSEPQNGSDTDAQLSPLYLQRYLSSDIPMSSSGVQVHLAADLATEVLQEIFLHLYYSATTTERIWGLFPTWLTPLHVCRTWRVALISYPRLWRYLPLESFRLTQIALTLSENMSLIVDAPPHAPISEDALTIALQHASRIEKLVCPANVTTSRALPKLCRLECFNCWHLRGALSRKAFAYDMGLLGGTAALNHLRELRIRSQCYDWDCKVLPPLAALKHTTALTVLEVALKRQVWSKLASLFETLRALPDLHSLALRDRTLPIVHSRDPGSPSGIHDLIRLTHLKDLCLEANGVIIERVFEWIDMPVCTRVELALYEGEEIHEEDTLSDEEENGPWEYTYGDLDLRAALVTKFGGRTVDEHPLEHLSVRIVDSGSGDGFWNKIWVNTHELASDIAHFTHLRTLTIRFNHFHPRATQDPTDALASTVFLPHLTHLHLSATTAWLYTAAATITTPDTTYRSFSLQLPSASHQEQPWSRLTGTDHLSPGWLNDLRTTLRLPLSTPGSYTDLYIVPARDRTGVRLCACGPTAVDLPAVLDLTLDEQRTTVDEWDDPLDNAAYVSVLECALKMLPLGDLHTLHVSHPRANALLGFEGALAGVAKARRLELAFYGAGGATLLALPKLEEICLRSLADLPTLPDIVPTRHTRIDVSHCAFSEEEVAAIHGWAGEGNVLWDGVTKASDPPRWPESGGECAWRAPFGSESVFWEPDVRERSYWTFK